MRAARHLSPERAVRQWLRHAAANPHVLGNSRAILEEAEQRCRAARETNTIIINAGPERVPIPPGAPAAPKRRKLFTGLGKLFSGAALLRGNAIVIPTITFGSPMALPVLGSLAAGMAGVTEGIGQLRRGGE